MIILALLLVSLGIVFRIDITQKRCKRLGVSL